MEEVLVHGVLPGDVDQEGPPLPPARPARPLPEGGGGARVAHQDHGVQLPDVHPELQGAGGDQDPHPPLLEVRLQAAALPGRVPRPVRPHQGVGGVAGDELRRLAGPGEDEPLEPRFRQAPGQVGRPEEGAPPALPLRSKGLGRRTRSSRSVRATWALSSSREAREGFRVLPGVGDGGACGEDLGEAP